MASAALYGAALIALASRALRREEPGAALPVFMVIGLAALIGGLVVDALALSRTDLRPRQTSYGGRRNPRCIPGAVRRQHHRDGPLHAGRWATGRLTCVRRVTFDNTMLLWHYTALQGVATVALVHGFPRLAGAAA
ncbi:MAG TPA: hypothetical protein VH743_15700 [Beijerinckiaceae bacterium]